jgi:hypothetical protein
LNPVIAEGHYSVFDKQLTIETERDYIRNLPNRGIFLVAADENTDRVVGFQVLEAFEAAYTGGPSTTWALWAPTALEAIDARV